MTPDIPSTPDAAPVVPPLLPPPLLVRPPPLPPQVPLRAGPGRRLLAKMLSLGLGTFVLATVLSVLDDSLRLFWRMPVLAFGSGLITFFSILMTIGIYVLMGLTPAVPKRLFLPMAWYFLIGTMVWFPIMIYYTGFDPVRTTRMDLVFSVAGALLGVALVIWAQGGVRLRWPLVPMDRLGSRRFSWLNSGVFAGLNLFVLPPLVGGYLFFCAALAVNHFSGGFMALHPSGVTVQARKYVREDGKVIELFPMSHVADAAFYRQVAHAFPTNAVILAEGVTDREHLLTNGISYKRLAKSLGLAEQQEAFTKGRRQWVRADVDVDQFSRSTIDLLNLVMRLHAKGWNPQNMRQLLRYAPPPTFPDSLFEDILNKRNEHLLEEIQARLLKSDFLVVPWGVAHMPGVARGIEKAGFHWEKSSEYMVVRFRGTPANRHAVENPAN